MSEEMNLKELVRETITLVVEHSEGYYEDYISVYDEVYHRLVRFIDVAEDRAFKKGFEAAKILYSGGND
jgi:hypothetical protein